MNKDPLAVLEVIKRLEVGPVRLEKRRLIAPYKVVQKHGTDSTDLIYRFEENVFEPGEPGAENLAAMIAAQVALNYGLFCEQIVFHGPYDRPDRHFLDDMARNTAREIFVKKFLEPNPFLISEARGLPPLRRENYLRSKLVFAGRRPRAFEQLNGGGIPGWKTERSQHAVLSSGGKDSLLSFGLLKEIKRQVHPIFVNEAGRHWFTALNAYRHFAASFPETARVWTNADRVFSWMLRHLPFVRQDFAGLRADEYPIRLWTLAVFLFGALPLLRKRGIGRLIIGDEFDTTLRLSHKGIPHYGGLYDQSRYFDNALTRYFHRKGWGVSQFSILRQLSELLIQKTLTQRYPELQEHQVSCHATHLEGARIRPCGQCEKCRRIVGMLMANGADPTRCGYSQAQIETALASLTVDGVHQESAGAKHMLFLLMQKGVRPPPPEGLPPSPPHPEVVKLRFDPEKSPVDTFPVDLREPLYRIFLEHAEGAVQRNGRIWVDVDPLSPAVVSRPYAYEAPPAGMSIEQAAAGGEQAYLWAELRWPQAQLRLKEMDVALLPVGSIEQHGPHLPLGTDAFDAEQLAQEVAALCSDPKPLVLPLISYGVSHVHDDFTGTISISPETLSRFVYEVGMSAARNGITKLVIINGHGGNSPALQFAAQMINRDAHIFTCVDSGETSDTDVYALVETPNDVHAGEMETSTSLYKREHLVRMEQARKFVPRFSSRYLNFTTKRSVEWYARTSRISASGVMGDPTKATREKGEKMWELMIRRLLELVEDLKSMSLDEIHQKRY